MISSVQGNVLQVSLDSAVISVGGLGFKVLATPATLAPLKVGSDASLWTTLVVREDSLTLYGFESDDERRVFEIVQTVSGVGPRLALAMLAVLTPDSLRRAIDSEDIATLCRVPGIGKKVAQRIALELAGKLGDQTGEYAPIAAAPAKRSDEVVAALVGLGWNQKIAEQTVTAVLEDFEDGVDVATVLRASLKSLGGKNA